MMKKIFYGWWIVVACFLISLYMSSIVFFGFTAFFEPLVKEFGWSYTQVSLAASLRGLEMGIFAFPIGFLVDRFGSRKLIFFGVITAGFGLILLSFTQSLVMFYGAILLLGLGAGGCTVVVTMSVVANWFDKNIGKAFGVMASGFGAGGLLVPVIVRLIEVFDWRTALILLGLGMWTLGIPLSFVIRNKPEEYGYLPDGQLAERPVLLDEIQNRKGEISFRDVLQKRSFLYLNSVEAIRMMAVTAVITHVMPYLSSVGFARTTAGLVAAAIPLFSIIGRLSFGWMGDLFAKRYVMALAFCFMGAGMLVFCYVQVEWVIFPFLLLFPPSFGGTMVLRGAILREYFGRVSFGKMLGIIMGSASIGGVIGPTLAGWVFDTLGSYQLIWLAFAGFMGLAIILVLRIRH
ncbi:MAG: MFS transporter [Deltaproteobacteria bacterium]|nr:MFS transporter [Deltaproteobacteria bacterium]